MGTTASPDHSSNPNVHRLGHFPPPDRPRFPVHPDEPPVMLPVTLVANTIELLATADAEGAFGPCPEHGLDRAHRTREVEDGGCKACVTMETLMWVVRQVMDDAQTLETDVWRRAARIAVSGAMAKREVPPAPPGDCE